jgi:hypothetical protein
LDKGKINKLKMKARKAKKNKFLKMRQNYEKYLKNKKKIISYISDAFGKSSPQWSSKSEAEAEGGSAGGNICQPIAPPSSTDICRWPGTGDVPPVSQLSNSMLAGTSE